MKIQKLILQNFASIFVGMSLKKIELDFSKAKNVVTLLLGPNGSGKTSILSNLHPFAYPGSVDVRNNSELILEGKDGYKYVEIEDDDNIYVIKHFYMFKNKNRVVKSFISKNGTELNPNGNVSSFGQVLEMELGLEPEFLKLLRLGSNVTSFINMKGSERTKFASELLSDIDVYSEYYKKINNDSRLLKALIKTSSDKLHRLNISDIEKEEEELELRKEEVKKLNSSRDSLISYRGSLKANIDFLECDNVDEMAGHIKNLDSEKKELTKELSHIEKTQEKYSDLSLEEIEKDKIKCEKKLAKVDKTIFGLKSRIDMLLDRLNSLYSQKDIFEQKINLASSKEKEAELSNLISELTDEIRTKKNELLNYDQDESITIEEAKIIIYILVDIQNLIMDILTYDSKGELEEYFKYSNNSNISNSMKAKVKKIDSQILSLNVRLMLETNEKGKNELRVLNYSCENKDCPFVKIFKEILGTDGVTEKDELERRISKLDSARTTYMNINSIHELILSIKGCLGKIKDIVGNGPFSKTINFNLIIKSLKEKNVEPIIETISTLNSYIQKLELIKETSQLEVLLNDSLKELETVKNNDGVKILKEQLNQLESQLEETENDLENGRKELAENESEYSALEKTLGQYELILEAENMKINVKEALAHNEKEKEECRAKLEKLEEYLGKLANLEKQILSIEKSISSLNEVNEKTQRKIDEWYELVEKIEHLENNYDNVNIIKESLSSKSGIPLLFIQLYLRSTHKFVNELLDVVYGGELQIESFIVTEKEFRIPYIKNGVIVEDVISASDGERAFISLIISLALIKQSIKKYNILLLDEVDAALDGKNRAKFLNILESYISEINAEQVFMITHNNAFDNFDANMIVTGNSESLDNYKKTNPVIFKR